jgi:hypothetical protein
MSADSTTNGFRFLAIVGAVVIIAMMVVPFVLGYLFVQRIAQTSTNTHGFVAPTSTVPGLGSLGYRCGGTARLPCGAGLVCSTEASSKPTEGVCIAAPKPSTTQPVSTILRLQQSGACQLSLPTCDRGFACVPDNAGSSCIAIDSKGSVPHILSTKIEGASYSDGLYSAPPGTVISLTVQATNATTVTYHLSSGQNGALQKAKGGVFTGSFVLSRNTHDDLALVASSSAGASPLWFRVASIQ